MIASLENLPSALTQMHDHLRVKMTRGVGGAGKRVEFSIDGLDTNVIVNMVRGVDLNFLKDIEGGEGRPVQAFCGGKLSVDKVKITVSPSNEKVEQVVASHFKSQVFHDYFTVGPKILPLFDEVEINGKKIDLDFLVQW